MSFRSGLYTGNEQWQLKEFDNNLVDLPLQAVKQLTCLWTASIQPTKCCICGKSFKANEFYVAYHSGRLVDPQGKTVLRMSSAAYHCPSSICTEQAGAKSQSFIAAQGDINYFACKKCSKLGKKTEIQHCPLCKATVYCSSTCMTSDSEDHHKECGGVKS